VILRREASAFRHTTNPPPTVVAKY